MITPDMFKIGTNISRIREINDRINLRKYRIFFLPLISSTYPFRSKTFFENIITPKNVIMHNIENAKCNFNNHIYLFSFLPIAMQFSIDLLQISSFQVLHIIIFSYIFTQIFHCSFNIPIILE